MLVFVYYSEFVMATRAYWKGYLKLSLISCPIAVFPPRQNQFEIAFGGLST